MRVAIIHDSLVEFGGAERVLLALLNIFPGAAVYTAYAENEFVKQFFPMVTPSQFHVSWVQNTQIVTHWSLLQSLSPLVWRSFNLESYDVVISATSYLAANMVRVEKPVHIQYIQSLPKNLYKLESPFMLQKILPYGPVVRYFFQHALAHSRYILTNSRHMQKTLIHFCGINSRVIYPAVNVPVSLPKRKKGKYYLCVTRIDRTKSIEISIEACNLLKLPLKIIGVTNDPPYERYVRSLAGPTIEFLGFLPDEEIAKIYQSAIAFLFSSKNEDFGIAPVEAMAHGVPVIAYCGGGATDTVIPGKTGFFFNEHTVSSLVTVLKKFDPTIFSSIVLYKHAKQYSKERFHHQIEACVSMALSHKV
ncbi:MAG: glycosyltransferase [Patescibacteria group bacterium]